MTAAGGQVRKKNRAKPTSIAEATPDLPIVVRWELHELPSAQHKAGLAGLAMCVKFLARKPNRKGVCRVASLDAHGMSLEVNRAGMQSLFDDVYDASLEEQERDKKLQRKRADGTKEEIPPRRTIERVETDRKGQSKTKTIFIYEQTIPRGALIEEWDDAAAGAEKLWLKLWRDLTWSILRGVPAQREPYEARAEHRAITDGAETWDQLASAPDASIELPSTFYLGAQAKNAEMVPFRDIARYRCLLNFWPFAVAIYVPSILKRDGDREFVGYTLAVPDIVDLAAFAEEWAQLARERSPDPSGYRPKDAVIDVPAEAGLDIARRVFAIMDRKQGAAATRPWVTAVDVIHLEKSGNNVRLRAVSRIDATRERADAYGRVRNSYWSPVFRRQRIINVLDGKPWWHGFGRLCATAPGEHTMRSSQFQHDSRIAFTEVEMKEPEPDSKKTLEQLIYQAVRAYVYGRLSSKYELQWDSTKAASPAWKQAYEEKKGKVARDAFLAVRSRTGVDFVAYFTGTLCSVPQRLGEQGYIEIARAFGNEHEIERIRSLTLLALAATA